jgi:hypothetical protein
MRYEPIPSSLLAENRRRLAALRLPKANSIRSNAVRQVRVIDSHTGGEPTRAVIL